MSYNKEIYAIITNFEDWDTSKRIAYILFSCMDAVLMRILTKDVAHIFKHRPSLMLKASNRGRSRFILIWCCSFGLCSKRMPLLLLEGGFWGRIYSYRSPQGFSTCPCNSSSGLFKFGSSCIFFVHLRLLRGSAIRDFKLKCYSLNLKFQCQFDVR